MKKSLMLLVFLWFSSPIIANEIKINKQDYVKQLEGFWLGQSIANWTGLITEMDKIGTPETLPFYTDEDWGKPDQKAFWGEYVPHASIIDFYFERRGTPWGADDDTDIEYMYLHLHKLHKTPKLTASEIRDGWLSHTYSDIDAPLFKKFSDSKPQKENFLWVSNERARTLMEQGMLPPQTSQPENNPHYNMIDAQLTTELFGLMAPGNIALALEIAELPISISASREAAAIANYYIAMHSLASVVDKSRTIKQHVFSIAEQATSVLPKNSFPFKMYKFIKQHYEQNPDKSDWESTRDAVYKRYQLQVNDGYHYKEPYDAGINFAASLISLFYGKGDIVETIRIGSLVGWDSDNPTATWGGLLGFMLGKQGIKDAFNKQDISSTYWIHRTRRNFPDYTPNQLGEDSFELMAERTIKVIDVILSQSSASQFWKIQY
ncbi:heme biosynthesis protein HemY [Pseudoalteromonas sp. NBT06-2]|uniref:ADP-ribosylglycohydrolase family protein n=1 Tax=Pseudoalteromonas sp. NBT06-2 TaxID=2025950 RepID=UPI000BA5DDC0|nr:ADP-ribosylglycohydrolase family protein [Pseudoalteromonas sp. NBT06-2]PAJ74015.1 heme biosynthesis protein HemY [Pseudoalteromonas sp. NBT06-2]